jgi:hypothetical protein
MLKKMNVFRIISLIFAIGVIICASYFLANPNKGNNTLYFLLLGLMFLFSSFSEYKENRKIISLLLVLVSLFMTCIYVVSLFRH